MNEKLAVTITKFWLIRHGEPDPEIHGRCYGALDIGLSARGRRQVEGVARRLAGERLAAIYCSPRRRAVESAEVLAAGRACRVAPAAMWREIDFGDFEGRTYDEIAAEYPQLYRQWMTAPTEVQFPNGESFERMRLRVTGGFQELRRRHAGETVALVTHGGVIRILLGEALGVPHGCLFRMAQRYAAVNLLRYADDYPSVELLNGLPGLDSTR